MKMRLIPLLLACLLITGCAQSPSVNPSSSEAESTVSETTEAAASTEEESPILTFEAETIDGQTLTSDCFADSKLTMINIWATYCNPCLVEMPFLGQIAEEYDKSVLQLIGIISDVHDYDTSVDYDSVIALIEDCSADTFPHLIVNRDLTLGLVTYITAVPTTFFVNQKGEVLGYITGAQKKDEWIEIIDSILAEMEK